jgi:tubulin-specific chaperone B
VQMSVDNVKYKLSSHCGTSPENMVLQLRDERGSPLAILADNKRPLGYYSPYSG